MSGKALGRVLAVLGTLALLVAGGAWWGLVRRPRAELETTAERIEAAQAALVDDGWQRPALGPALPGDARRAAVGAAAALPELSTPMLDLLGRALRAPMAAGPLVLPPDVVDALRAEEPRLLALADAARRRYTEPRSGAADDAALDRGILALLASAATLEPGSCLRRAGAAIRIGQDRSVGLGVAERLRGLRVPVAARRVVLGCATRAFRGGGQRALDEAAAQLRLLASHPPPVAPAVQREQLANAAGQVDDARALLAAQGPMAAELRAALRAAKAFLDAGLALGALRSDAYPAQLAAPPETWPPSVVEDASAQGVLRALGAAVALLAAELRTGTPPTAAPDDAALADPFTGAPFQLEAMPLGFQLLSLGPDGRRDATGPSSPADAARRNDLVVEVVR